MSSAQQIIGREGETATLYERRSLNLKLRVFGFAPRQLNRYALSFEITEFVSYEIKFLN